MKLFGWDGETLPDDDFRVYAFPIILPLALLGIWKVIDIIAWMVTHISFIIK